MEVGGDAGSGASMPGQGSGSGAMPGLSLYMVSYGAMPVGRGDAGSGASMASGAGHRWHQGRGRRKGHRRVRGDEKKNLKKELTYTINRLLSRRQRDEDEATSSTD